MATFKIITIDDSNVIRKIINQTLKTYDATIIEAENGAEGLEKIQQDRPDLIILDLTMPVMDGLEFLEKIKADPDKKSIPIIMLTAESGKDVVIKIAKFGVRDYIAKPFKSEQVIEKIRKHLPLEEKKVSKYFIKEGDINILLFPETLTAQATTEIKEEIKLIIQDGAKKVVTDLTKNKALDLTVIQLLGYVLFHSQKADIKPLIVTDATTAKNLKSYQETMGAITTESMDDAKKMLGN